jgi:hypothetical protein
MRAGSDALAAAERHEFDRDRRRASVGGFVEQPTEAELRVLRLLPTDLSLREIGAELFISHNTVNAHTRALYHKLGVDSRDGTPESQFLFLKVILTNDPDEEGSSATVAVTDEWTVELGWRHDPGKNLFKLFRHRVHAARPSRRRIDPASRQRPVGGRLGARGRRRADDAGRPRHPQR